MREVAAALGKVLPELEIRSLQRLGEGDFCRAFLLNDGLVVRIPKHGKAARALAREACLLEKIEARLTVSVPRPRVPSGPEGDASSLSIHEWLPGTELTSALWRELPEGVRRSLAGEVGRFLRELHALDVTPGRQCGLEAVDHDARLERLLRALRQPSGHPPGDPPADLLAGAPVQDLTDCLEAGRSEAHGWWEAAILHADLSPGHVLVDPERGAVSGIIDWGDAFLGDPARDFIFLYEDWGDEFLDMALEAYAPAEHERFLRRVYLRYLADQLEWTLEAAAERRSRQVELGIRGLARGVADHGRCIG